MPIADSDPFPRRVSMSIHMAEKDDGGGFDELISEVSKELACTLSEEVGKELDSEITESAYYAAVEDAAGDVIQVILSEISKALGLGLPVPGAPGRRQVRGPVAHAAASARSAIAESQRRRHLDRRPRIGRGAHEGLGRCRRPHRFAQHRGLAPPTPAPRCGADERGLWH